MEVRSNVGSDVKEVVAMDDEEEIDMTTGGKELPGVTSGDVEVRSNAGSEGKVVVARDDEEELGMGTSDIEL